MVACIQYVRCDSAISTLLPACGEQTPVLPALWQRSPDCYSTATAQAAQLAQVGCNWTDSWPDPFGLVLAQPVTVQDGPDDQVTNHNWVWQGTLAEMICQPLHRCITLATSAGWPILHLLRRSRVAHRNAPQGRLAVYLAYTPNFVKQAGRRAARHCHRGGWSLQQTCHRLQRGMLVPLPALQFCGMWEAALKQHVSVTSASVYQPSAAFMGRRVRMHAVSMCTGCGTHQQSSTCPEACMLQHSYIQRAPKQNSNTRQSQMCACQRAAQLHGIWCLPRSPERGAGPRALR